MHQAEVTAWEKGLGSEDLGRAKESGGVHVGASKREGRALYKVSLEKSETLTLRVPKRKGQG
jgi:hypothetical protein